MSIELMRLHSRDEFQTWLAQDVEVREELYAMAGGDFGIDTASLDGLEAFLLERYASPEDALVLSERTILDAAARHVGLVLLLNVDGTAWSIDLDNEDNVYWRLPIIRLADRGEECPITMVTSALDRRFGDFLRGLVENYQHEYNDAKKTAKKAASAKKTAPTKAKKTAPTKAKKTAPTKAKKTAPAP